MRPYDQGRQAAIDGKDFWENPYTYLSSKVSDGHAWFAGWCYGKKSLMQTPESDMTK